MKRYGSERYARTFDRLRRRQETFLSTMKVIDGIRDLRGARVVELGAGTGVVTEQLASKAAWVEAFDRSPYMIQFARKNLRRLGVANCSFSLAEHRDIPLPSGCADAVVAAWSLDSTVWDASERCWRSGLSRTVREMKRLAGDDGTIIILASPYHGRRDYGAYLQRNHGFERQLYRTVWKFHSRRAARGMVTFFLQKETWREFRSQWRKSLVILGGVWWRQRRGTFHEG